MLDKKDLYTYQILEPINEDTTGLQIGTTIIAYEIRRYIDVRNLVNTFAYQIFCTQRIIIPNQYSPGAIDCTNGFSGYPAIVANSITPNNPPEHQKQWITDYSPRTVNASINQTISDGSNTSGSTTWQATSGSSTSESNTFGVSATLGMWGEDPNASISANASTTSGSSTSNSTTTGTQSTVGSVSSVGDTFSIKEWACYANTDSTDSQINWVWGQEYPWDVIQYRAGTKNSLITLPSFVQEVMKSPNDQQLLPPSLLSQFGVDFTMKASWIVEPTEDGVASFQHVLDYFTGAHQWDASGNPTDVTASFTEVTTESTITTEKLDLYTYGLDPITSSGVTQTAIVGFVPQQFNIAPSTVATVGVAPKPFKILALTNNLLIEDTTTYSSKAEVGAGWSASGTAITGTFSPNCNSLRMNVSFKVIDMSNNFKLYMKHWIVGTQSVDVTIAINGNTVEKLVDAPEGEGGQNNLLKMYLRNLDFGSVDYQDFLQFGHNVLTLTFTPNGTDYSNLYQMRALSIETE